MTNKINMLYALICTAFLLTATKAPAVETLRPEDEDILTDITAETSAPSEQMVLPIKSHHPYSTKAPRKVEFFNPNILPTRQNHPAADPKVNILQQVIADCLTQRKERLAMEQEMLSQQNTPQNAAYLSQTITEINLCYEDIGREIIETFYNNAPHTLKSFSHKAKTFYVTGTDAAFDTKFCQETCSMQAIIEAQIAKFAEFRAYLNQLLKERPIKE